ncbi:MAG: universal stress protein [Verrucomicrobia bacterium]|jgi:nucleotide-binding universal stress UspA family protein|nr:universal stress protein [Verrucomicrobiota bacterium]
MKVRKADRSGKVTVELTRTDDALLEKSVQGGRIRLQTLLVPVDFSACSVKAADYAVAFAQQFQAGIVLLHVVEPMVYPENYMTIPAVSDDINGSLMKAAEDKLAAQRQRMGVGRLDVKVMTRLGRPYVEIAEVAKDLGADLIVLGTHGHTGWKHVLLGSTAERVVRHAPCPVLTVRDPEHDFIAGT